VVTEDSTMNDPRPRLAAGIRPAPDEPAQPYVRAEGVTRKFGEVAAVDDVTLEIYRGEVFCLLGGSGCGKTTLLRILAGLEPATTGRVLIDGEDVTGTPPFRRPVNMMFQSYALFPHLSVRNNVAFGLRQDGLPSRQINRRVASMLELVKLGPFARRKPHQLSGGQRQRVALARALVKQPKLLLLDEPLGALDRQLREEMQFELINIQQTLGITFVVVTHDQEEAMTLSSRIGVMHAGRIVQTGTPTQIYEYPRSRFVAQFVGSVNLFEGRVEERAPDHVLIASEKAGCTLAVEHVAQVAVGAPVAVAVRPEKLVMAHEPPGHEYNHIPAIVDEVAYRGGLSIYKLRIATGHTLHLTQPNRDRATVQRPAAHDAVFVSWHPASGVVLDS